MQKPRMTAAEKKELYERNRIIAQTALFDEKLTTWYKDMMVLLEKAHSLGYNIRPNSDKMCFTVFFYYFNEEKSVDVLLSPTDIYYFDSLSELEYSIATELAEREEFEKKQQLKRSAIAKLTKEEYDALKG